MKTTILCRITFGLALAAIGALTPLALATGEGESQDEAENADHKIAPLEVISVYVYGEKDLSIEQLKVSARGLVRFPLFTNDVTVTGKTTAELADELEKMYKFYLVKPHIIVFVKEYRKRDVYVNGEVMRPGPITLPGEQKMTILDAIGQAGGETRSSNHKIEFTRKGKTQRFRMEDLRKISDQKMEKLEPGDTITVGQSVW